MGRYLTTGIEIKGTRTKKYRNILHTIIIGKIEELKKTIEIIPLKNGELYYNYKSTLQGGKIIVYRSGGKYICKFKYHYKKNNESWSRRGYITYEEYQIYLRDENINQLLDQPSEIIDKNPKLEVPMDYEIGKRYFVKEGLNILSSFHCSNGAVIEIVSKTAKQYKYKTLGFEPKKEFLEMLEKENKNSDEYTYRKKSLINNFNIIERILDPFYIKCGENEPKTMRYSQKYKTWDLTLKELEIHRDEIEISKDNWDYYCKTDNRFKKIRSKVEKADSQ